MSMIDFFFPGFTGLTAVIQQLLVGNLDSYARLLCVFGVLIFLGKYAYRHVWQSLETHFSLS